MLVFIDESGDTGLKIGGGASKYFTIVMVIFSESEEALACDQRISLLRKELRFEESFEFHFHENSDRIRKEFFNAVRPYQFFYYGIIIDKKRLFGMSGFSDKESFYKYACGLLFENVRDKLDKATVIIDESGRELFKYQLAQYLRNKINTENKNSIYKIKMQDSRRNNLLQLVDMVAGAINRSLNSHKKNSNLFREAIRTHEIRVQIWPN